MPKVSPPAPSFVFAALRGAAAVDAVELRRAIGMLRMFPELAEGLTTEEIAELLVGSPLPRQQQHELWRAIPLERRQSMMQEVRADMAAMAAARKARAT